jgi:DNA mismatch repair protein MutL
MPQIRVLPDPLVNRIAAGEVVERPASAVKELVENALDAGAERIEIELAAGGRSLIRVADDGSGMDADDALLALERHATSKISGPDDLEHIATLGFRGEALPSIAAVSRFRLTTCADPAEGGVAVTVEGGRILGVEPAARPRGTTVEIRDLFFNTPARRKFLSSPETELRHAQEVIWGAALARPDVAFRLVHGGRTLIEAPPTADPAERLRALWRSSGGRVHHFEASGGGLRAWGLLAPGGGSGRPALTLLVNGRAVKDRLLVGAVRRGLREGGAGFGGSRVVLFVDLDPSSVDVNVHPAKAEVRFSRSGAVFATVERALRAGVAKAQGRIEVRRVEVGDRPSSADVVGEPQARGYGDMARDRQAATVAPLFAHPAYGGDWQPVAADGEPSPEPVTRPATGDGHRRSGARERSPDTPFGRLIGQYRDSFLLLEDEWGLVIVDQHVAHERVLYDQILRRLAAGEAPSQRLLVPVLVEVDEVQAGALDRVTELLAGVGVEADLFGPDTVRVSALPPELDHEGAADLVRELLDRSTALDGVPERAAEALAEELAASLSCRGAIKVNHPLTSQEQRALLADLRDADNPYRCPHGRPIVLRLSQEEMERRLGRR